MRTLLLSVLAVILAASANAQDAAKAVRTIRDVTVGMSRETVLSGLSERFTLTQIDKQALDNFEVWYVLGKSSDDDETAKIAFEKEKVFGVSISLYTPMTGEAVRFAERLFRLLYDSADPPSSPGTLDKVSNRRHVLVPVELQDIRGDKMEDIDIEFKIGKQQFSVHVTKLEGYASRVEFKQNILDAATQ
jgi:hypothetical protein